MWNRDTRYPNWPFNRENQRQPALGLPHNALQSSSQVAGDRDRRGPSPRRVYPLRLTSRSPNAEIRGSSAPNRARAAERRRVGNGGNYPALLAAPLRTASAPDAPGVQVAKYTALPRGRRQLRFRQQATSFTAMASRRAHHCESAGGCRQISLTRSGGDDGIPQNTQRLGTGPKHEKIAKLTRR